MESFIVLDTETTGLDETAEIVEISAINHLGEVLLDSLVKPTKPIPSSATAIHGITNEMVANAPTYDEIHSKVLALLEQGPCYIYNSSYDTRLIRQTAALHGLSFDSSKYSFWCVMEDYAHEFNQGYWEKLIYAYSHALDVTKNERINLKAHRSLADCYMTLEVVHLLQRQTETSSDDK